MEDINKTVLFPEKIIDIPTRVISWLNAPKEEAREHLLTLIKENQNLTPEQQASLIYNSRKLSREYANSKTIYEKGKKQLNNSAKESEIDDDWMHFFFDKAGKVSNESMQLIWARLLAGEFSQPGSISRKLMHILSIMDVSSAHSFRTFCNYVFERKNLFTSSYSTEAVIIPDGFYIECLDFVLKSEDWLRDAGFLNYKDLAIDLTMNTGELNSLENLGLVQKVSNGYCEIPLIYHISESKEFHLVPRYDASFPLGIYSFTAEGRQLYNIIGSTGCEASFEIIKQYLKLKKVNFQVEIYGK